MWTRKKKLGRSKSVTWSLYWRARKGLSESPKPFKSGATTQLEPLRPRSCNLGVKICKGSTLLQQLAKPRFVNSIRWYLGSAFSTCTRIQTRKEKLMEKSLPSLDSSTRTRSRRSRGAARRAPASVTHFLRSGILFPESIHFLMFLSILLRLER